MHVGSYVWVCDLVMLQPGGWGLVQKSIQGSTTEKGCKISIPVNADPLFSAETGIKRAMFYLFFLKLFIIKGIFSASNNIFLWHESEDIHKKSLFSKFQLIPILRFQVMHDYVGFHCSHRLL